MKSQELDIYIERYLNGESSAFDVIYEETKKGVYLAIYTIIKNASTIEDLMQDTYMKAIASLEYYQLGTNFKAWISRIGRNTAINYYNHYKKQILVDDSEQESLFGKEERKEYILDEALSILEGYEKEIFTYRIVMDYTLKEIGTILNMPLTTVHYIYKKTLKKVKKYLVGEKI